jgi:hypothetical protein
MQRVKLVIRILKTKEDGSVLDGINNTEKPSNRGGPPQHRLDGQVARFTVRSEANGGRRSRQDLALNSTQAINASPSSSDGAPPAVLKPPSSSSGPRPAPRGPVPAPQLPTPRRHATGAAVLIFRPLLLGAVPARIPLAPNARAGGRQGADVRGGLAVGGKECRGRGKPFCGGRRRRMSRARGRRRPPLTGGRGGCMASPPPSSWPRGSPFSSSTPSSDTATVNEV